MWAWLTGCWSWMRSGARVSRAERASLQQALAGGLPGAGGSWQAELTPGLQAAQAGSSRLLLAAEEGLVARPL
jgi:hypothetical protein